MMDKSHSSWSCSKDDDHEGLNRGAWTAKEDMILSQYIRTHGVGRWRSLAKKAGLKRSGKSCRLRWLNYLRPDIKRGNIYPEEEELIIRLHRLLGNRWSLIAGRLPGRTDNEIKNYWNAHLRKKVEINEFEPKIQKPFKSWGMPSYSDYKDGKVQDKDDHISQTTPMKKREVRYSGKVSADVDNYINNNNYDLIQNTYDALNTEEASKAADDHVVEIDTSKTWCQILLEDCIGDGKCDRFDVIDGLEANRIVRTHSFALEQHLHPQFPYSTLNYETDSSYSSFDYQEFPNPKKFHSTFESLLDLSELPSSLP